MIAKLVYSTSDGIRIFYFEEDEEILSVQRFNINGNLAPNNLNTKLSKIVHTTTLGTRTLITSKNELIQEVNAFDGKDRCVDMPRTSNKKSRKMISKEGIGAQENEYIVIVTVRTCRCTPNYYPGSTQTGVYMQVETSPGGNVSGLMDQCGLNLNPSDRITINNKRCGHDTIVHHGDEVCVNHTPEEEERYGQQSNPMYFGTPWGA